jgi:serralysin
MPAVLTFSDDFNSLNLWNGNSGTWATNFWYADQNGNGSSLPSNGEQEWYINSNYAPTSDVKPWTVNNGVLTLTAAPASAATSALINGYQYTSGEINTYHSFSQTYGYFEMKAELPAGQGLWPAFWLLQENGHWPPEIDVMEMLGNDPSKIYTTVHTEETGTHTSSGLGTVVADTSAGYHTYGVDWEADEITFYFDGKAIHSVDTPDDMHSPMYMIANLAVGGYWPGNADSTTPFPAQMNIDYIHAYSALPTDVLAKEAADASVVDPDKAVKPVGRDDVVQTLAGGNAADTITASHVADTLTGGAGADVFVIKHIPWSAGHITDFAVGVDKLDISALLKSAGYSGSDPVADGYLSFASDGAGGTTVMWDSDGHGTAVAWSSQLIVLDHVSPVGLTAAQLFGTAGSATVPTTSSSSTTPATTTTPIPTTASTTTTVPAAPSTSTAGAEVKLSGIDAHVSTLVGGAGADTLAGGHQADILTGGAGADTFAFKVLPWNGGHITDFAVGVDKLDLTALAKLSGYTGTNPVADGYLSFASDGMGGTKVYWDADAHGTAWPTLITTLDHVSPAGLTAAKLLGTTSPTASTGPAATAGAGVSLSGNDAAVSTLTGNAGADTLSAAHQADTLTGGAGADHFVFTQLPWNAGHITDFTKGQDLLDLRPLFQAAGYHGADPVADAYLSFRDDGQGNTQVYLDTDGSGPVDKWPFLVTTLDHVAASTLHSSDYLF